MTSATAEDLQDQDRRQWSDEELLRLPRLIPITTAGSAMGWSKAKTHGHRRRNEFPLDAQKIGRGWYCKRADLLDYLRVEGGTP